MTGRHATRVDFLEVFTDGTYGHAYWSTACRHQRHEQCRDACKFCDVPCGCTCHLLRKADAA